MCRVSVIYDLVIDDTLLKLYFNTCKEKTKGFFLTAVIFNHAFHVQILLLEMLEFNGGNLEID